MVLNTTPHQIVPAELLPGENAPYAESLYATSSPHPPSEEVLAVQPPREDSWDFNSAMVDPNAARWEYRLNEEWQFYGPSESARIEKAFQEGGVRIRVKTQRTKEDGREREIFFGDMVQYDPVTGTLADLRRLGYDSIFAQAKRFVLEYWNNQKSGTMWNHKFLAYKKMKKKLKKRVAKPARSTFCKQIVMSGAFTWMQIAVIILNTIFIGVEVDYNGPQAMEATRTVFGSIEHVFCTFFTVEIILRFGAMNKERTVFKAMRKCLKNSWFMFDFSLVLLMVVETWVMPLSFHLQGKQMRDQEFGLLASLRLLRLMRLSRIGRIARLLSLFPEIFMVVKSIIASTRAVLCTFGVLLMILYIFAIAFKVQSEGSGVEEMFPSILGAMYSLMIHGAFMDNLGDCTDAILEEEDKLLFVLFISFMFLSNLTMLNMLIGVICDVANDVSSKEKKLAAAAALKDDLMEFLDCFDINLDKGIGIKEFDLILGNPDVRQMLEHHDVDVAILSSLKEAVFQVIEDDVDDVAKGGKSAQLQHYDQGNTQNFSKILSYDEMISIILRVKGGGSNQATMQDILDLERNLSTDITELRTNLVADIQTVQTSSFYSRPSSFYSRPGLDPPENSEKVGVENREIQPVEEIQPGDASLKLSHIMTVFSRLLKGLNLKTHEVTFCMDLLQHLAKSDLGDVVMPISRRDLQSLIEECCESIQDNSEGNKQAGSSSSSSAYSEAKQKLIVQPTAQRSEPLAREQQAGSSSASSSEPQPSHPTSQPASSQPRGLKKMTSRINEQMTTDAVSDALKKA